MADEDHVKAAPRGRARALPLAPRLKLQVNQSHIDEAAKKDSRRCMIAQAITDTFPWARRVTVDASTIRITDTVKGLRYVYPTPERAMNFLVKWDYGVKPPEFALELRKGVTLRSTRVDPATGRRTRKLPEDKDGRADPKFVRRHGDVVRDGGDPPPVGVLAGGSGVRQDRFRKLGLRSLQRALIEAEQMAAEQAQEEAGAAG